MKGRFFAANVVTEDLGFNPYGAPWSVRPSLSTKIGVEFQPDTYLAVKDVVDLLERLNRR